MQSQSYMKVTVSSISSLNLFWWDISPMNRKRCLIKKNLFEMFWCPRKYFQDDRKKTEQFLNTEMIGVNEWSSKILTHSVKPHIHAIYIQPYIIIMSNAFWSYFLFIFFSSWDTWIWACWKTKWYLVNTLCHNS